MTIEAALLRPSLLKPVVDALLARLQQRRRRTQRLNAELALRDAIRELLRIQPDERRVEARLASARAGGASVADIRLVETMLARHRETHPLTRCWRHLGSRRRSSMH